MMSEEGKKQRELEILPTTNVLRSNVLDGEETRHSIPINYRRWLTKFLE